jgi:hypothetical protein
LQKLKCFFTSLSNSSIINRYQMAVEQSMKIINMMRANGWITVSDNDIWGQVSADLAFSGPMRKHASDATRILAGNSASVADQPKSAKKAPKKEKANSNEIDALKKQLAETTAKVDNDVAGRAQWGTPRYDAAQRLGCDPAILIEGSSRKHGMGIVLDGTWKLPIENQQPNPFVAGHFGQPGMFDSLYTTQRRG